MPAKIKHKPAYKLGAILRYDVGPTALFRFDRFTAQGFYVGQKCAAQGEIAVPPHRIVGPANERDMVEWRNHAPWRCE